MSPKIRWIGPTRKIPDLGITVEAGDEIEVPKDTQLGGEGQDWEKVKTAKKAPKEE